MKNLPFLLFLCAFAPYSLAQITIRASDIPRIGQEIEQGIDTLPGSLLQPDTLPGGIWDLSGLAELHMSAGGDETGVSSARWAKSIGLGLVGKQPGPVSRFRIYPNPATTEIVVETPEGISGRLAIIDLKGKLMLERNPLQPVERIRIGKLPKGSYTAIVRNDEGKIACIQRFDVRR